MPDPRQKLYSALQSKFDLGTLEEFNSKMDNPESRQKLYKAVSASDFDLGTFDEFESKIGGKKKSSDSGTSTSEDPKSVSAPKPGSSAGQTNTKNGFPKIDTNSIAPNYDGMKPAIENPVGKAKRLQNELSNVKVTPENMDQVSAKTDELSAVKKQNDKIIEDERRAKVKALETSFYEATRNNDDDAVAEQRLQDAVQVNGVWNNVKDIAKKSYNAVVGGLASLADVHPEDIKTLKTSTDPLSEEKKQIVNEAKKNKEKLTDLEVNQRAQELFKSKEKDNLFVDRANSFLDNLDSKDKEVLKQDRALKADHLEEDNLKRLKVVSAMRTVAENKISEYKNIEGQLTQLKENNQPFPEELFQKYQSLGSEIKNIGSELQKNEDYILKNKKDLGTAQQEFDLFKREYGDIKNFVGNIGASASELGTGILGAVNYAASFSPNAVDRLHSLQGQEIVSGLDKQIEENRGNLRKPVESLESAEGFMNYASDLVANQIPILVATSTGMGGLSAIGASSTGKKFTEMNNEVLKGKAEYSPLQMAVAPLLYGAAEVVSELPTMNILKKGGRVLESVARNEADLLTKTAKEKAKEWAKDFGVDMSKEMSGEQFTNFTQNFNDKYVLGKKDVNLLDNTGQVFKDTFTLTSMLKVAPHAFGAVVQPFQSKSDLGKLDENSRKIIEFSKQLNSEDLTDTEKQVIQKQIDTATAESSKIVANTIGKIDNMPSELYDEVVKLNTKAGEIKAQAREIADGNLSNKKQLLDGLQEEYKAIQEQRNSIVDGRTSAVEVLPLKEQDKLKKQALEDLVTELDPDGKKNMKITDEQVLERANEIYTDSKANEKTKTEVNLPLSDAKPQQNGSKAEVNLPQKENVATPVSEKEENKAPSKMDFSEEEKAKVQEKVVNKPRVILRSGKVGEDAFFALPNEGVFGEVVDKVGNDENVTAYRYPKDFKIKDLSNDVVFDDYMSNKMFEDTKKEGYDAAYVMEIDGSKVLHVINPGKLELLDKKLPELRNNEAIHEPTATADGNVRLGTNGETVQENNKDVQPATKSKTNKGEVGQKLEEINKNTFGLDDKQSKANAVVMEKTIETMAKRAGISKEEMFDKIDFEKGDSNTIEKLSKKGKALFQIIGKNAKLTQNVKDNLNIAKDMTLKGANPKDIFLTTGWEKGTDGKWKYDMLEGKVEFKKFTTGLLGNILDYNELFEKYPKSKEIRVIINDRLDGYGMFNQDKNAIYLNPKYGQETAKSTLLHELQHWVQRQEGFSKGGSAKTARQALENRIKTESSFSIKKALTNFRNIISTEKVDQNKLDNELSKLKNLLSKKDFALYESIAGEVEARNVEKRVNMTSEERRNTPLSETEDVARDEQIVLFQGEQGAMLAEDGKFIIYALEDPNVSTPLHELAHVYEHYLNDSERKTVLDDAGHDSWTRETSEHFARGFEKYLADGIAPNPEMKSLFEDFKKWLTDIYNGIKDSEIDIKLSPAMQKVYDEMLGENKEESSTINYKGSDFTIIKKSDGEVKILKKDGSEIKQYTWRKTKEGTKSGQGKKRVKNANYAKILAVSEGNLTDNEINVANKKQIQESIDNFIPSNEYEVALLEVAKGTKFSKESIEKELGNKDSNWASDQFSKKKLASIENVAEGIVSENEDLNLDEKEVRNALIDVISSFENLDSVKQEVSEIYQKSIDPYYGLSEEEAISAYEEYMTDSERALFESVQAESDLNEDEKLKYYQEQYEKSIESISEEDRAGIYEQYESERLPNPTKSNEISDSEESSRKQKSEEVTDKTSAEQFLNWLDEMENNLDQFGKENLSSGIPIVVAKASIQAMRVAVKAGMAVADVIQAGIDALKQSEWYINLSHSEKSQAERDFMDSFGNPKIDNPSVRQTENLLNRSVSDKISEDDAYEEVKSTFEKARTELSNTKSFKEYSQEAYRNFVKRFTDRQYLAKSLLNKSGMKAVQNLIINSHGASGKAKVLFEEAYDKVYKKLTTKERQILDEIIQAKRFIAIDNNREARGLEPVTHPNFIDKNKSEKFLSKLEKEIGTEKYQNLEKRADAYFKTYKDLLNDMLDNGLISQASYDSMSDVDYQPRVFLQFVTDFNGDLETNKRANNINSGGLSSEQIKSMSEGDANSLVLNSEWLLSNSLLARHKAIAMNNINKRFMTEAYPKAKERFDKLDPKKLEGDDKRFYNYFKELSSKVIDNPVIGETDSGNPKYKYDKTPANFQKAYYYEDGKQHQFFLEKELYDSWTDNIEGFLSSNAKEVLSYASGAALVKAIATGNNPAFPIVNTPRDLLFTTAFSDQYSNIVPKAMLQIGKDVVKSIKEIRKPDSDILKKYMEYGGAMDFLSSQGTLKKESLLGQAIDKAVSANTRDIAKNLFSKITLHKISQYSEMMFRLGIFQRSIKNQLRELGYNDVSEVTDKKQLDDIYNEAVASARSILDFNQGGSVTKDLESVIPYINVAFQGGRVAATAFEKDPVGTTSRVLQLATLASAVPIGASLALISAMKEDDDDDKSSYEIYLKAIEGISQYQKMKYMNIVTGKKKDGEYMVIKVAKAQELSPIMSVTDDIYNNMIRSMAGKEKKSAGRIIDDAAFTFNSNVMPIDFTSPAGFFTRTPVIKATLTYATGYDFFREEPLSNDIGKTPLAAEGLNSPNVEDFYKKLGTEHGLSPVRSKAFVESLITGPNTNPFVGMLYGGADAATSDKGMKEIGKDLFESVYKSTGKRIISYSSDFNRQLAATKELQEKIDKINVDKYKMKAEFNQLAKDYINKDISKSDLNKKLEALEPDDRKRMTDKIKDKIRLKGIDGTILDIKYEQGNDVKALMIMHYYGDLTDGSKDSKAILLQMKRAKGILTPGVMAEYRKLKQELAGTKAKE
jgi:hypothetical protein